MRELRILAGIDPAAAHRAQMRRAWRMLGIFWGVALVIWLVVTALAWHVERSLGKASVVTGYALFAVILSLAFFKVRKRLLVLPLGTVREWMLAHIVLGAVSIPLFFQHTGGLWPDGRYEQVLAIAFYVVTLSGIGGYVLQRLLPRRLADLEGEFIYERIPSELASMRTLSDALRAQTHEHANRLHTIVSLMELGRVPEALDFATKDLEVSQRLTDEMIGSVDEPVLSALLMGKFGEYPLVTKCKNRKTSCIAKHLLK